MPEPAQTDVCIVGLKCYDLLTGAATPRYLGGIEKVLVTYARGLRDAGLSVSVITYDHDDGTPEEVDGIKIFKAFEPTAGLRYLRTVHPRLTGLRRAMAGANARTYVYMGAGVETGLVAFAAKRLLRGQRRFVLLLASDGDCDEKLTTLRAGYEKKIYRWGVQAADAVVSQTTRQQEMLKANLGKDSSIISMPLKSDYEWSADAAAARRDRQQVIWIGRIVEIKRLEWLLDVAEKLPEIQFNLIGDANTASDYGTAIKARAAGIANVAQLGKVDDAELARQYREATMMISTSSLEGFPVTFLEAWAQGIPVVTSFDPDNLVATHALGAVSDSPEGLAAQLQDVSSELSDYVKTSRRCYDFFQANYTLHAVIPALLQQFAD